MTKNEIIYDLWKKNTVQKIVNKLLASSKNPFDCPQDLIQDIYLLLLEKDDTFIIGLYEKGDLGFWLLKVVRNQLLSVNSRYYYTYIKLGAQSDDITKASHLSV